MPKHKDTSQGGHGKNIRDRFNHTAVHNIYKDYLIKYLSADGHFVWNNETGFMQNETRAVRYGFPGSPDILGIANNGLFLGVEVKTYSSRQSKKQKAFESHVNKRGGVYYVAHTSVDTQEQMDGCAKEQARSIQQAVQKSA